MSKLFSVACAVAAAAAAAPLPLFVDEATGLLPAQVAIVINVADPQSQTVGSAYQSLRGIPAANVVRLNFGTGQVLPAAEFAAVKQQLDAALGPTIQALALTWLWPYRVDCMSVTSAFALGYDKKYCSTPCATTAAVPYYNSSSSAPFTDFGIRPAMLLAGWSAAAALRTAAAGVASDGTRPRGDGFLFRTPDAARSVRYPEFQAAVATLAGKLNNTYLDCSATGSCGGAPYLQGAAGVLAYFQSLASVPAVASNTFLPGAVGDHLTSYGGILTNTSGQMSCLAFLEAGATGSYGTVVEPCNYVQKFPDPSIMLPAYYGGGTLVEAYWKSVQMPGEGIFVGEPLARPWKPAAALAASALLSADGASLDIAGLTPLQLEAAGAAAFELWACACAEAAAAAAPCCETGAALALPAADVQRAAATVDGVPPMLLLRLPLPRGAASAAAAASYQLRRVAAPLPLDVLQAEGELARAASSRFAVAVPLA